MSVKVNLTPYFRDIVDRNETIQANGHTIGEILTILKKYPGLKKSVSTPGKTYGFLEVYLNQGSASPMIEQESQR